MKLINFGSVNVDHVYQLNHLVRKGETIASTDYRKNEGGKGFNQAVALAKAGQKVYFAGAIGADGLFLKESLNGYGVDTMYLEVFDIPTGHAIIQVDEDGSNSIILYGGANRRITEEMVERVLNQFAGGDVVLLQNEICGGNIILREAARRGLRIVLNPSPITPELLTWPLEYVEWFILNEVEAEDMTGEKEPERMLDVILRKYPRSHVVLTLGEQGAICAYESCRVHQPAVPARAVDSTAAGDTFTGYFLHSILNGDSVETALTVAVRAAAITVSRPGAAASIPVMEEVRHAFVHKN